ncbi:uncharacterized protein LOC130818165 isoform X1 [Amaranthus tricolor]|uniref:uncharacterized protein LOC130818165 isoform X1 n=1 Tax=Amaranthus tricolor TaxID=29722 RepID=UPI00258F94E1|nr:uncharacterized protein LOC130818165 isoform X1 [Amaranthus tricolor]
MTEIYQDFMGICETYGYPDVSITFTCNLKWPEITRFVNSRGLRLEDRPDIRSRVFKMKLDNMVKDLKRENLFGRVLTLVYSIEFQKGELPHAHIVLFLHRDDKISNPVDIDKFISVEMLDKEENPHCMHW